MSRYYSYLNTAENILQQYRGAEPFAVFIKKFFAAEKKYGSGDRKTISHLCYCYFRAAALFPEQSIPDKIVNGLFLCSQLASPILLLVRPDWEETVSKTVAEKLAFLSVKQTISGIFPLIKECSEGINQEAFALSHLSQPDLFIRVRPGYENTVPAKLDKAGITFRKINSNSIAIASGTKLDDILQTDREMVIQDLSSQRVGEMLQQVSSSAQQKLRVWDCCAASGGKSIMAKDILGETELAVTDIRASILSNLAARFRAAGISRYRSLLADISREDPFPGENFDLIIADVPCTGSGTWGRTPEQLVYFNQAEIAAYVNRQQQIVINAGKKMAAGGHFLYITCSAFKKENEEITDFIQKETGMLLLSSALYRGYEERADTMYAALFRRPL